MIIDFLTSNSIKFKVGQAVLEEYQKKGLFHEIRLRQNSIALDEIQSLDVRKIAVHSAKQAYRLLKRPIAVTDAGLYVEGLNGFPGPFLKFMNYWFQPEDILRLMHDRENAKAEVRECLAIADLDGNITTWDAVFQGRIAGKPSERTGTTMERIFIPKGAERVVADMTEEEQLRYWQTDCAWEKWFGSL